MNKNYFYLKFSDEPPLNEMTATLQYKSVREGIDVLWHRFILERGFDPTYLVMTESVRLQFLHEVALMRVHYEPNLTTYKGMQIVLIALPTNILAIGE